MTAMGMAEYIACLIDRNKIPFKELWQEARFFADDIVCAVGTDFMQKIAEAEHKVICDLLNRLQQMEVVDAATVVRCRDCKHYETRILMGISCAAVRYIPQCWILLLIVSAPTEKEGADNG